MNADQDIVIKAVTLISETFEENDIPKLEGGIAMLSILATLKDQGLDLRSEPNMNREQFRASEKIKRNKIEIIKGFKPVGEEIMDEPVINYQAYICPWCFDDHSNDHCKTEDVKMVVGGLRCLVQELADAIQVAYNHMPGQCKPGEAVYMDTTLERALTRWRKFNAGSEPVGEKE